MSITHKENQHRNAHALTLGTNNSIIRHRALILLFLLFVDQVTQNLVAVLQQGLLGMCISINANLISKEAHCPVSKL